jgi:hypothetical protein
MARVVLVSAVVVSMLGCGSVTRMVPVDRYTVTTELMQGGPSRLPLIACHIVPLSLPPPGCGGVEVRGVDVQRVPGARRLSNGVIETDSVRLVGTWDGSTLNITELPRRATPSQPSPTRPAAEATARATAAIQRVTADWQELKRLNIQILEYWTDGDSVAFLVPVVDQRTMATLEQRYGPVLLSAWLQRA